MLYRDVWLLLGVYTASSAVRCRTCLVLPATLVFPAGKTLAFRHFPVSPVFHFGEGVSTTVCRLPGMFRPQWFSLGSLAYGGSLQAHRDSLGWARHQGDGLSVESWNCWCDSGELKHLVLIWKKKRKHKTEDCEQIIYSVMIHLRYLGLVAAAEASNVQGKGISFFTIVVLGYAFCLLKPQWFSCGLKPYVTSEITIPGN